MTEQTKPTAPRGRWAKGLLIASLGVNLLIFGAVAGHILSGDKKGPSRGEAVSRKSVGSSTGLRPFISELPREKRGDLMKAARKGGFKFDDIRRDTIAKQDELETILAADTLDGDKLRQALGEMTAIQLRTQEQSIEFLATAIENLSDEERAAYAVKLKIRRDNFKRRGKDWKRN